MERNPSQGQRHRDDQLHERRKIQTTIFFTPLCGFSSSVNKTKGRWRRRNVSQRTWITACLWTKPPPYLLIIRGSPAQNNASEVEEQISWKCPLLFLHLFSSSKLNTLLKMSPKIKFHYEVRGRWEPCYAFRIIMCRCGIGKDWGESKSSWHIKQEGFFCFCF